MMVMMKPIESTQNNLGRPESDGLHSMARLARRLLIARSEGTSRFAGPSSGLGGRRRANRIDWSGRLLDLLFGRPAATLSM